ESIKKQKFFDYEIILADAGSKDKTIDIAKEYNCKIIPGGLPAKGRNEGAKIAKGELLFFLDADTVLPNNFLKKALSEFNVRNLEFASFCLVPLPRNKISYFFMNIFYNQSIILLESALPHAAVGILVKKNLFEKLGGYDEDVKLAEDHYLARRAQKLFSAKLGIIKSTEIFVSDRRFRTDGWISTGVKCLLCELHLIFLGPVKSDIFKYKFDHYKKKTKIKK
ncbi:MAG: glycosyltransferase, partial [Ignavibacteria bacterium]|nr:glycosyltransferase [Ignavibacteria bacterium]